MVVREGCERSFEEAWVEAALVIRRRRGSVDQEMLRDPTRPRKYVITAVWDSLDALHDFERSPERQALSQRLEPLRELADKAVFDVVVHIDGERAAS